MKKTLLIAALLAAATLTSTAANAVVMVRSYARPVIVTRTVVRPVIVHRPSIAPVVAGVVAGAAIHHMLAPRPVVVAPVHPVVVAPVHPHVVDVCDTMTYEQRAAINAKAIRLGAAVALCHQ